MSLLIALAITTLSMAQSTFPTKALTLAGSGSVGKNSTSYVQATVGSINHVTGVLYVQPRLGFLFAKNVTNVSVALAPTIPIKTWGNCSFYGATEASVSFSKGTDAYLQFSPELGVLCSVGKNAFVQTTVSYGIKDDVLGNPNHNVGFGFGVGFKL